MKKKEIVLSEQSLVKLPGFADVHVHFREPGFSYKETVRSGSMAAARGGYCAVCTMPNLDPTPDSPAHLRAQLEAIEKSGLIHVLPYGTLTVGEQGEELADMEGLAPLVCGFSDDGKGVQSEDMMRRAMLKAKSLGKLVVAHCEDNSLLHGGYIHDGDYARSHGHMGISSESEWRQLERDLRLVRETHCAYHMCHMSTKESVELMRQAKKEGLDVSCETAPHYLVLTDADLQEDGRFKMNPPLRGKEDREALIEGLLDGTVDMIATDHAPHTAEEKGKGLAGSSMGIVGLETAFPVLYTALVRSGIMSLDALVEKLHHNPCRRFGIELDGEQDHTLVDLAESYTIDPADFLSMGRATPFAGMRVWGKIIKTVCGGKTVYEADHKE